LHIFLKEICEEIRNTFISVWRKFFRRRQDVQYVIWMCIYSSHEGSVKLQWTKMHELKNRTITRHDIKRCKATYRYIYPMLCRKKTLQNQVHELLLPLCSILFYCPGCNRYSSSRVFFDSLAPLVEMWSYCALGEEARYSSCAATTCTILS